MSACVVRLCRLTSTFHTVRYSSELYANGLYVVTAPTQGWAGFLAADAHVVVYPGNIVSLVSVVIANETHYNTRSDSLRGGDSLSGGEAGVLEVPYLGQGVIPGQHLGMVYHLCVPAE